MYIWTNIQQSVKEVWIASQTATTAYSNLKSKGLNVRSNRGF